MPAQVAFSPGAWRSSEPYLYGVDLYNHGYFWECHEIFEAFWHAFGRETPEGEFFHGLIQIAAANLKRLEGIEGAAQALARRGVAHLNNAPSRCMGVDVSAFITRARSAFLRQTGAPDPIRLVFPEDDGA